MTTQVLLVSGSLQRASANRAVLDVAREELASRPGTGSVDSDEVRSIPAFNPDDQDRPPEAVTTFRRQIGDADAVLFAVPEYAAALPGALKNALDWVVGSGELYGKLVAVVSAGTTGGPNARKQLLRTLTWQGAHVVAQLDIVAPRTKSDASGRIVDPETIESIQQVAHRVVEAIGLAGPDRLALVAAVTSEAGIEPGHVAPMPER